MRILPPTERREKVVIEFDAFEIDALWSVSNAIDGRDSGACFLFNRMRGALPQHTVIQPIPLSGRITFKD